ncbi:MAG TPA: hypothetical protein VGM39_23770 [Kofleriaceae bacterium]|jgi:hypothetical protein
MRWAAITVLVGCGSTAASVPENTATADTRWIFRVYASLLGTDDANVTTYTLDEEAHAMTVAQRSRHGRDPWIDDAAKQWSLSVIRGAKMSLRLTSGLGGVTNYRCELHDIPVAPASAQRASQGGKSEWRLGRWTVPTHSLPVQVCTRAAEQPSEADAPAELWLADVPIEHVIADDACCTEDPSVRRIAKDGALVSPRNATFPTSD